MLTSTELIADIFPSFADDIRCVVHIRRGGSVDSQQLGQVMLERFRAAGGETIGGDVVDIVPRGGNFGARLGAASEVLGAPAEDLLRVFGEYWMTFTAEKGYGETLEFAGSTFREFLENLDEMHARISLSFPHLQPPSFDLEELEDGRLELHYHTDRPGLAPMVIGLLNGLAKRFGQEIDLIHEGPEQEGGHDRFLMSVRDQAESEAA